jgi:hypothetical protein
MKYHPGGKTLGSTLPNKWMERHSLNIDFPSPTANQMYDSHSGGKACTAVDVESVSLGVESRDSCSASLENQQ